MYSERVFCGSENSKSRKDMYLFPYFGNIPLENSKSRKVILLFPIFDILPASVEKSYDFWSPALAAGICCWRFQQHSEIARSKGIYCRNFRQYAARVVKRFYKSPAPPVPIGANNAENQNRHRCRFWLGTVLSLTKCNGFPTPLSFIRLAFRQGCRFACLCDTVVGKAH